MRNTWLCMSAVAALALTPAACGGTNEPENNVAAEDVNGMSNLDELPPAEPAVNAATGRGESEETATAGSILAWSRPAAGSTVSGPVSELVLHFSPPARLGEVTVTGPDGAMPMMVTAVGEVEHYSLPLSDLGAGSYTVDWRASARGVDYRGSFGFQVR